MSLPARVGNVEALLGGKWESLPGWRPVLKAIDTVMELPPAGEVTDPKTPAGEDWPASDVVSVSELAAFMMPTLLADAMPIWIGPTQLAALPDWPNERGSFVPESAYSYLRDLHLPFETVFLDFTDSSGQPAWLPPIGTVDLSDRPHDVRVGMYAALAFHVSGVAASGETESYLFADDQLVICPFGCAAEIDGSLRQPVHGEFRRTSGGYRPPKPGEHGELLVLPQAGTLGWLAIGEGPLSVDHPSVILGDARMRGVVDQPRPMLGLLHLQPLGDEGVIAAGIGKMTAETLAVIPHRLGVHSSPSGTTDSLFAEAGFIAALVVNALKAFYLLESANVELVDAPTSRQVRRAVARSEGERNIARVVQIRSTSRRRARKGSSVINAANYSHSFDRRGSYHHVTRGRHVRNPDKLKPCPEWQQKHPHSELCRREWHPDTFVDAGPDKPYVPKTREWS